MIKLSSYFWLSVSFMDIAHVSLTCYDHFGKICYSLVSFWSGDGEQVSWYMIMRYHWIWLDLMVWWYVRYDCPMLATRCCTSPARPPKRYRLVGGDWDTDQIQLRRDAPWRSSTCHIQDGRAYTSGPAGQIAELGQTGLLLYRSVRAS